MHSCIIDIKYNPQFATSRLVSETRWPGRFILTLESKLTLEGKRRRKKEEEKNGTTNNYAQHYVSKLNTKTRELNKSRGLRPKLCGAWSRDFDLYHDRMPYLICAAVILWRQLAARICCSEHSFFPFYLHTHTQHKLHDKPNVSPSFFFFLANPS